MKKPTFLMILLLGATPLAAAAQQQPTVPPTGADTLRPRMMQRWQGRPQMAPRPGARAWAQRGQMQRWGAAQGPRFQGQGWVAPRGQMGRGQQFGPGAQFGPGWGVPQQFAGRGAWGPGIGLFGPGVQQELGLTDEQVKRLDAIREEVRTAERKRMDEVRDERREQLDAWRAEQRKQMDAQRKAHDAARERMLKVLTPEQQKKLEELRQQGPRGLRRNM